MRSGLPRLRELTGAPASAPRAAPPTVESAVPEERRVEPAAPEPPAPVLVPVRAGAPPAAQAAPAPPETPRRREPDRVPPPIRAPALRAPIPLAQTPAAAPEPPEEEDDGRGILLPEIFDRVPGEPAGDYRIVRGAPIAATSPRAEPQASLRARTGVPETVLVAAAAEPPPMPRRREIPMPSAYADRVPPPGSAPRGLPIRLIGIAGFLLGIAFSMTLMLSREYEQPPMLAP